MRDRHKVPVLSLINGESADNNKYAPTELISKKEQDQLDIAYKTLEPLSRISDEIVVTRGTEAHVGESSTMDELVARMLGALPMNGNTHSWYRFRATIEGVRIDAAHHPATGHRRSWTRGNDANRLAKMILDTYVDRQDWLNIPHLALRAHNHKPVDSYDTHQVRAIIGPSWQLTNSFGHKLGGEWLPVGGHLILCRGDGEYSVKKLYSHWPIEPSRTLEEIRNGV